MYETILVPVDGSEAARRALQHAIGYASTLDASVYVLTVVEPSGSTLGFDASDADEISQAVSTLVESIASSNGWQDVSIRSDVRRNPSVHEAILEYAEEIDADMIVLGRHGTSSLPDSLVGSTADRVTRLATIPVTLVPERQDSVT